MKNPSFEAFVGPMFSSKTCHLIMSVEKYKYQSKHVIAFKPKIDDRYSQDDITTHNGWKLPAVCVSNGYDMYEFMANSTNAYSVVAVDELFMIEGASEALIDFFKMGLSIVVSTLDLSAKCKPFKEVTHILPWATSITKCTAVCTSCGSDARYTYKKFDDDTVLQIGGVELYEPRCQSCHPHATLIKE